MTVLSFLPSQIPLTDDESETHFGIFFWQLVLKTTMQVSSHESRYFYYALFLLYVFRKLIFSMCLIPCLSLRTKTWPLSEVLDRYCLRMMRLFP